MNVFASRRSARERGQTLIIAVLVMGAMIGFTAMTIDVGLLFEDRRQFQNSADAMALAGVAELPSNAPLAEQKARDWAAKNNVDSAEIKTIEVRTTGFPNDTLYVELEGEFEWIFGRALGLTSAGVGADAAARTGTFIGGHDMMPWALLEGDTNCLDSSGNAIFGATCAVKVGAQNPIANGWRGALDYDGNGGGGNEYHDNIIDGTTDWSYCIAGQETPGCHSVIDSLSGNKVGPTGDGIQQRLAQGAQCDANSNGVDDFDEVFEPTGLVSPAYSVACPDSPWLIIIPIVSFSSTPVQEVTIEGFTLAYLRDYGCFTGLTSNLTEQPFVSTGQPAVGGDTASTTTAPTVSKPCNHNTKAAHDAAIAEARPAADSFVMAIEPGQPIPGALLGPAKPPACHQGTPHGQQQCATATPTPAPSPSPSPTPSPTPAPTASPTPGPTATPGPTSSPTPGPAPDTDCKNGKGHWQVSIEIADATYSMSAGFLGAYDPDSGIVVRRLIQ